MPSLNFETIITEAKTYRFFRNHLVITFTLLLLFGILALALFVLPRINSIKVNIEDLKKRKEELAVLTRKLSYLESLNPRQLKTMSDVLVSALPISNQPGPVIREIELISRQTNFNLKGISAKPGIIASGGESSGPKLSSISYSVSGSASEPEFVEFINQLESTFPLLVAEDISFNYSLGSVTANFNIFSYYSSLPQKIGSISSPLVQISDNEQKLYQRLAKFKNLQTDIETPPPTTVGKENPFL